VIEEQGGLRTRCGPLEAYETKRDVRGVASDAQPIDQSLVPRTLFYVKGGIIHSVSETQRVERKRKKGGRGDVPGHGQIEVRNSMGSRKARETSRATVE